MASIATASASVWHTTMHEGYRRIASKLLAHVSMNHNCSTCHAIAWHGQDTTAAYIIYKYEMNTDLLCSRSLGGAALLASPACRMPAQVVGMLHSFIQDRHQYTVEAACKSHTDVYVMHAP